MKTPQVVLSLVGIIALVIAFEVGHHLQPPPSRDSSTRLVTISASSETGKCGVDYPVVSLSYSHHIQWKSNDNKYWVSFLKIEPPPGENPLVPPDDPVIVDLNHPSRSYNVKPKTKYYMYAIFDHDPTINPNNPCKAATDDRDTGLNVKP